MKDRFQTLLFGLVLMGVGALTASFWLEWRAPRVADQSTVTLAPDLPSSVGPELEDRLRVEVLNGSGDRGAARQVADRLRELGFDIVYFGNADSFGREFTSVVNRSGETGLARLIADSVGVDSVGTDVAPELYLDASILSRSRLAAHPATTLRGRGPLPSTASSTFLTIDRLARGAADRTRPRYRAPWAPGSRPRCLGHPRPVRRRSSAHARRPSIPVDRVSG